MIEAALFAAGKPVSIEELSEGLGLSEDIINKNIKKIVKNYSEKKGALEITKAGNKYCMQVTTSVAERVKYFAQMEIPAKVLKTAALIAYHQPIKQSELQEMFGSKVYDHVKVLDEMGLVKKRHEGRTIILSTTSSFSEYFGIDTTNKEKIKDILTEKVKKGKIKRTTHRTIKNETKSDENKDD